MILSNIKLGNNVSINPSTKFNNVEFGDNVKIAKECHLMGGADHILKIGAGTICGMYVTIDGPYADIEIGECVSIGQQAVIRSDWGLVQGSKINKLFDKPAAPIRIGSHTWIGSGCVIAPGVTVGDYSIVASNSYVDKEVPPFTIVGGNPAKVLRTLDPKELGL